MTLQIVVNPQMMKSKSFPAKCKETVMQVEIKGIFPYPNYESYSKMNASEVPVFESSDDETDVWVPNYQEWKNNPPLNSKLPSYSR